MTGGEGHTSYVWEQLLVTSGQPNPAALLVVILCALAATWILVRLASPGRRR